MKSALILLASLLALAGSGACVAAPAAGPITFKNRWQYLPPTPAQAEGMASGYARVNGVELYYATLGQGSPVILLHGGLANANYWGKLVPELARTHRVIVMDSRGHGRSSRDARPYGYDLMTDDVIGLLDYLKVKKASLVGWSDGAIIGLDMAMRFPDRLDKLFAFAPNTKTSGIYSDVSSNPVFAAFERDQGEEYRKLSKTPDQYPQFVRQISHMWASQPNWSDADLGKIKAPTIIADGDHDEAIKRSHLEYIARTIPQAGLLILPNTSHFAHLQAPREFNQAVISFLDGD